MLDKFGYKLDEICSIFNSPEFTTLVLYSVQLYEQMYCTLCTLQMYTILYICTYPYNYIYIYIYIYILYILFDCTSVPGA